MDVRVTVRAVLDRASESLFGDAEGAAVGVRKRARRVAAFATQSSVRFDQGESGVRRVVERCSIDGPELHGVVTIRATGAALRHRSHVHVDVTGRASGGRTTEQLRHAAELPAEAVGFVCALVASFAGRLRVRSIESEVRPSGVVEGVWIQIRKVRRRVAGTAVRSESVLDGERVEVTVVCIRVASGAVRRCRCEHRGAERRISSHAVALDTSRARVAGGQRKRRSRVHLRIDRRRLKRVALVTLEAIRSRERTLIELIVVRTRVTCRTVIREALRSAARENGRVVTRRAIDSFVGDLQRKAAGCVQSRGVDQIRRFEARAVQRMAGDASRSGGDFEQRGHRTDERIRVRLFVTRRTLARCGRIQPAERFDGVCAVRCVAVAARVDSVNTCEWKVSGVHEGVQVRERLGLAVTRFAGLHHATVVRILVACGAVLVRAEEAPLAFREHCGVRQRVACAALQFFVFAVQREREAVVRVVVARRETGQSKGSRPDEFVIRSQVFRVALSTIARRLQRAVKPESSGDLVGDSCVTGSASRGRVAGTRCVTTRAIAFLET